MYLYCTAPIHNINCLKMLYIVKTLQYSRKTIHPFSAAYLCLGRWGCSLSREDFPLSNHLLQLNGGTLRCSHASREI